MIRKNVFEINVYTYQDQGESEKKGKRWIERENGELM
jgi:hypothetical protein